VISIEGHSIEVTVIIHSPDLNSVEMCAISISADETVSLDENATVAMLEESRNVSV
jgi:hypothetical protein